MMWQTRSPLLLSGDVQVVVSLEMLWVLGRMHSKDGSAERVLQLYYDVRDTTN